MLKCLLTCLCHMPTAKIMISQRKTAKQSTVRARPHPVISPVVFVSKKCFIEKNDFDENP